MRNRRAVLAIRVDESYSRNMSKTETIAVELWMSYVGHSAPSNATGGKVGLGWTKEQASEHASHWANQASHERFRKVTLVDHAVPPALDTDQSRLAWRALGWHEDHTHPSELDTQVLANLRAGRYASAWLAAYPV
jgi:hypothetical protein